ncbi:type III-A CRISPR-associated RAMP protein Csm4 [Enterococcus xiangfangensis]|uniref:CRISPR system Cms protein Csm4 n=1 Tax=Enterococcus xiangfangensis TaxID=1296537 RepID=A0ABU3FE80_9ENTE|nr:type III-A CRISPR-associated RAMP protein Csm4 [Enterococcus xiangfangensis]MDT2760810.1 type III-A CRISPR-associated RAMP protein Csm4 [Enterococcus xiangfangensis]
MKTQIIRLSFNSPVHFGNKRLSDSEMVISSDTLFSALFIEALNLNLDTDLLMKDLVISDTFPYCDTELFLPKPLIKVTAQNQDDTNYKMFKKLKYVPVSQYLDYVNGKLSSNDVKKIIEEFKIGTYNMQTKVSLKEVEKQEPGDSEPYAIGTYRFYPNTGVYFIAKGTSETLEKLMKIMDSLQYSGLGGKRFSGYGRFTYQVIYDEVLKQLLLQKGSSHVLLSTARGTEEELETCCEEARFILKKRTGFIQSASFNESLVKKKDFYSFTAGSVFTQPFKGEIYDVGENGNHPVYRYAKAFWLEVS